MGPIQHTARPSGDVYDTRRPLARPVSKGKELALPSYRREITRREIGDEWTDGSGDYPLFVNAEPVPPRGPVASLEAQACRCQIVDDVDNISVANIESQMVRDRWCRPGCGWN